MARIADDSRAAVLACAELVGHAPLKISSEIGDWLQNLMNWFTWLPDGSAVRAEHLARWSMHLAAMDAFIEVTQRGLPLFSDGIRFTYDRLRFYTGNPADIADADATRARGALERIELFVRHVDFTKPVTTFLGSDPNHPRDPARVMKHFSGGRDSARPPSTSHQLDRRTLSRAITDTTSEIMTSAAPMRMSRNISS
jgi:hypothetical protein